MRLTQALVGVLHQRGLFSIHHNALRNPISFHSEDKILRLSIYTPPDICIYLPSRDCYECSSSFVEIHFLTKAEYLTSFSPKPGICDLLLEQVNHLAK